MDRCVQTAVPARPGQTPGNDGGRGLVDVQAQGSVDGVAVPAGLTQREAEVRRRRGEANTAARGSSRGYARILRTTVSRLEPEAEGWRVVHPGGTVRARRVVLALGEPFELTVRLGKP